MAHHSGCHLSSWHCLGREAPSVVGKLQMLRSHRTKIPQKSPKVIIRYPRFHPSCRSLKLAECQDMSSKSSVFGNASENYRKVLAKWKSSSRLSCFSSLTFPLEGRQREMLIGMMTFGLLGRGWFFRVLFNPLFLLPELVDGIGK